MSTFTPTDALNPFRVSMVPFAKIVKSGRNAKLFSIDKVKITGFVSSGLQKSIQLFLGITLIT